MGRLDPFAVDRDDERLSNALIARPSCFRVEPRSVGPHSWALVEYDGGRAMTMLSGPDRDDVESQILRLREARNLRRELDAKGVPSHRYHDLMDAVEECAGRLGADISGVSPIAFVDGWLRHSGSMEAGWMNLDLESVERMAAKVLRRRGLA